MAIIPVTARPRPEIARAVFEYDQDRQGFAAHQILPPIPSPNNKSGTIPVVPAADLMRAEEARMAAGSAYPRGHLRTDQITFNCEKYGREEQVTDEDRAMFVSILDAEMTAGKRAVNFIRRRQEVEVAAAVFNTSTWTGAALTTDVSGTNPWATVGSNHIKTVTDASEKVAEGTGMPPNALILNTVNLGRLLASTQVVGRYPGAPKVTRQMLRDILPDLFDLEHLIVCGSMQNTAAEGQTHSMSRIWSSDYVMVARVATSDDPAEPCLGRTIRWTGPAGFEISVATYRENQTDSDIVQAKVHEDHVVYNEYHGHLIKVA